MLDTEHRLKKLKDRAALQDLVVRYFLAADDDDYATLADIFADDAAFSVSGHVCGEGRDAVMAFLCGERQNMGITIHTHNSTLFNFQNDDHATGVVSAHLEMARGGHTLYGAVRYYDEYIREVDTWRIRKRNMLVIHVGPWENVGTSLTDSNTVRWPGLPPQPSDMPKKRG